MKKHAEKNAIEVVNLSVRLDRHLVLDDLTFSIPAGSTAAIIGPNGAGKSVLLKTILKLIPIYQGAIKIFGADNSRYRDVAPLISYIPQHFNLETYFPLTVWGLFALKSRRPLGQSQSEEARMLELLDLVGAGHLISQRLTTLSGGQLQRALLAFSLMDQPKLLLLDEPAAGIDAEGQKTIYQLLQRIQQTDPITIVMVSHELQIVMNYTNQVICLNKKLVCSGHPEQVLTTDTLQQMYGPEISHFHHLH